MNIQKLRKQILNAIAEGKIKQADVVSATGIPQSSLSLFLNKKRHGLSGENTLLLLAYVSDLPVPYMGPDECEN